MDFKNLPRAVQQSLRNMLGSTQITPQQKAQLSNWIYGGAPITDPMLQQGVNNILRANGLAPQSNFGTPAAAPQSPTPTGVPAMPSTPGAPPPAGPMAGPSLPGATATPSASPPGAGPMALNLGGSPTIGPPAPPRTATPSASPSGAGPMAFSLGDSPTTPTSDPSRRQENGPGFGPSVSSTVPQFTPGGANTLGTANLMTTPATAPPTPPAAGPGSLPFAQNAILGDPQNGDETMLQLLMERIGIDPGNPGLYGGLIGSQINEYLPYFRSLLGLQGQATPGAVDTLYTGGLDQLAGMIGSNKFYSGLQDYAGKTKDTLLGGLSGPGGIRDVGQQQKYLNALLSLSTAGQNPLLRQSAADDATRAWLGYRRANYDNPLSGTGGATSYIDWLAKQNDPRYGSVLTLLGGGGR